MSDVPADFAARARALDASESFIVQAPAGSGKTELLTQRYLRLLATVEAPEQIIAITFTRKAAAEMRQRILQALDAASGDAPTSPHKLTTWELARAVRAADQQHRWQLERQPARLRIQTIDAFSAGLARRLPVLAGTGSAIEPTDDSSLLYEAACEQLIARLGEGTSIAQQLEALIVHLGNRVDRLIELLSSLLAKRDQWLHPIVRARGMDDLRAALEDTLHRAVNRHLAQLSVSLGHQRIAELLELSRYAGGNLLTNDALSAERRVQIESCLARTTLEADSECLLAWQAVVATAFNKEDELFSKVDKRHGFPTSNAAMKQRLMQLLAGLRTEPELCEMLLDLRTLPQPCYRDDQWKILEALLELLPAVVAELQLVFQSRAEADYVEIALRALQALGPSDEPTDLALAFDYRLQHLLVDEFQDTSFAQLDLLERLTAGWQPGDGRTLFCVGDPMQSIYRFRQAEVGLFIQLQQHGFKNVPLTPLRLEANFRSEPTVIDWVNRAFPQVLASRSDAEQGAVQYSSSVATRHGIGSVTMHPSVNGDAVSEAITVTDIVRGTLELDRDSTIAVLVSTRTRVDAIARELTRAGIEFQAIEIERLRDRPVVQDLIALTRALVHLADRTAWLAVLRAPWCGIGLADLHALAQHASPTIDEALQAAVAGEVSNLSAEGLARLERTYAVLNASLAERGRWPLRTWIERAWNALSGPATLWRDQDLDDAESYFGRLDDIEAVGDLEDVARLEEQLERLFARPRHMEQSRVEVMTIHAAKGLEFDTVILPGLQSWARNEDRELLRWTRIAGEAGGIVLAPIKADGSEPDPIYRWIDLLERRRVLLERGRLLYVAATRAKRHLHLLGNVDAKLRDGDVELSEPRKGSMLRMLWHVVEPAFADAAPGAQVRSMTRTTITPQRVRRLPLDWSPPAPAIAVQVRAPSIDDAADERPIFDWVTQTSRHVGTLVHRELDRMLRTNDHSIDPGDVPRLESELAELGVPPVRCNAAAHRVQDAIIRMLQDERGRWLLGLSSGVSDLQSELALTGVVHGQLVQGVIDRTFLDAAGTRWIVDFKTTTHEGGGLEAFLDEQVVRYAPQLARYANLMQLWQPVQQIKMALYFPLLGAWREIN